MVFAFCHFSTTTPTREESTKGQGTNHLTPSSLSPSPNFQMRKIQISAPWFVPVRSGVLIPALAAAAAAAPSVPPTSGEGRHWEPDLRAPALSVSPSIMSIPSLCIHPRPRGAQAASSPHSAWLNKTKPPLLPSSLRPGASGAWGCGPGKQGRRGSRRARGGVLQFAGAQPAPAEREGGSGAQARPHSRLHPRPRGQTGPE